MDIVDLKNGFIERYGGDESDIAVFFAPGRVNLIGEHTDYNGGFVLPFSLHYGTYLLARPLSDPMVKFKSLNFKMGAEVCMKYDLSPMGSEWVNYPLGILKEFKDRRVDIPGMALMFAGNIPSGAGLSSSASIEMVTAFALNKMLGLGWHMPELIKLSQHAENNFVGMKCGIMDQFAVGMGEKGHAVFLDCDTLNYSLVPFDFKNYLLIITNTNKRRELAGSKYNERRAECEMALWDINRVKKIKDLSKLTWDEFEHYKDQFRSKLIRNRAEHVVGENHRVLKSVEMLKSGNLEDFGQLMFESHYSLRDLYEVSCRELDILVEEASKIEGVIGSRMTGAGFGGCTITLIDEKKLEIYMEAISRIYKEKTGLKPDFYLAESGNGIQELKTMSTI
ncbi:MAG: galactokinase [Bacteroidales bacterium]